MLVNFARATAGASITGAKALFPMSFSSNYRIVHCVVAPSLTSSNSTVTWSKCINMTNFYVYFVAGWTGPVNTSFESYDIDYIAFGN